MKNSPIQYYVEGEDEKRFLTALKTELQLILPGNVQVFNVITQKLTNPRLMLLKPRTIVVLIYDTDTKDAGYLYENIDKLKKCATVSKVVTIPQCRNLEDELVYASDVNDVRKLLNSNGRSNFKRDLIHTQNLGEKLKQHHFSIEKVWSRAGEAPFDKAANMSKSIKI